MHFAATFVLSVVLAHAAFAQVEQAVLTQLYYPPASPVARQARQVVEQPPSNSTQLLPADLAAVFNDPLTTQASLLPDLPDAGSTPAALPTDVTSSDVPATTLQPVPALPADVNNTPPAVAPPRLPVRPSSSGNVSDDYDGSSSEEDEDYEK